MSYQHIDNLYRNQEILAFKKVFALEKIHGTSAHISFTDGVWEDPLTCLSFFSGGAKHESFVNLFNKQDLLDRFRKLGCDNVTVYGEAYGGKEQGMSATYGKELKFIAFDVKIGDLWLSVPDMAGLAQSLGLAVVSYERTSPSVVAR